MMRPGDRLEPITHLVATTDLRNLAVILRDPNPIHLDPAAVMTMGLGERAINQGPANLAYIANMLLANFKDHRIFELESTFLATVFDGDEVTAIGEIISVTEGQICCSASLVDRAGKVSLKATAIMVPRQ